MNLQALQILLMSGVSVTSASQILESFWNIWSQVSDFPARGASIRLRVVPHFSSRDSRASETRARVKITPREKRRHAAGREKNEGLQTKPKLLTLHGRLILECEVRIPFQIN